MDQCINCKREGYSPSVIEILSNHKKLCSECLNITNKIWIEYHNNLISLNEWSIKEKSKYVESIYNHIKDMKFPNTYLDMIDFLSIEDEIEGLNELDCEISNENVNFSTLLAKELARQRKSKFNIVWIDERHCRECANGPTYSKYKDCGSTYQCCNCGNIYANPKY